ncbi:MAG: amidohydrolase family protein [Burkholderiaceae bacterium]|nr:amidohydrolase family protein [Microbacteriaceae bacterium]
MSLLLRGARLVGRSSEPTDVLLKHGVITAIGESLTGTATLDLGGRWLMPGLWDGHVHVSQAALTSRRVDVSSATSAAQAVKLMAAAPRPPAGLPLVGFGFQDALWPDVPTAALLDERIAGIPVVLVSRDLHCCWLNTVALGWLGLGANPTGIVREDDAFPVTAALQNVPEDVLDGWVAETVAAAARRGVVGIVDFEMSDNIATWSRRFANGFRGARIDAGVYSAGLDAAVAAGHHTGEVIAGTDGFLTVGPFKVITDGSLNTRTAYCSEPYPGLDVDVFGALTVPPAELIERMRTAHRGGFVPAVHAIGDEANRLALDAFAAVGCGGRIEHAQLLRPADVARFAELGVAASVQPEHAMDDREIADHYWAGRTDRAFPIRTLLEAGARVILGSDAPVAPLDPWISIASAVGRSRDGREPWHPEQTITAAQAIAASTREMPGVSGGSGVSVGDIADLAIVELDPLTASHEQLRRMPVAATLLAGYFTHNAL